MELKNRNILISGASIAGPALAYWLARHGFSPTVVERAPAVRKGGYSIDVRGAAIEVADRMGILPRVRAARTSMRGVSFRAGSGGPTIDVPVGALVSGEGDYNVEIARGDLCDILYEATKDDVEYVFDDSMSALRQDDGQVDVSFERREPESYGLVVGADGLHSLTRTLTFPAASQSYRHLGAYVSIFTVPNHLKLDHWTLFHNQPGRLAAIYSVNSDDAKALFAFRTAEPLRFDHRDEQQQKRLLAAAYTDAGWEVPRLLEEMRTAPDFYFDSISQIHMDRWSNRRVALVGDAGYGPSPASGQGTSLALVGAYVLAGELARSGGDHRPAFDSYERRMREFVRRNQRIAGSGSAILVPASGPGLWARDQFMRAAPLLARLGPLTRLTDTVGRAATAIDLPDYGQGVRPGPRNPR